MQCEAKKNTLKCLKTLRTRVVPVSIIEQAKLSVELRYYLCLGSVCAWWGLRRLPRWRRCTNSDWVSCRQNRWRAHSSAERGWSGQNKAGGKECLLTSFEPQLFRTNCTLLTIGIGIKDKALGTFWGHSVYIVPLKSNHHFFTSFAKFWQIVASIRYAENNYYKKDGGRGELDNNQLRHLIA